MRIELDFEKKLEGFSLRVQYEGEAPGIGILGASGCGKSMTLRSIAGIEKPDRGRIAVGGRVLFDSEKRIDLRPQERRAGYLFQNYALFPTMTVEQNILAGVRGPKPEKALRAQEMIRRFALEGLEKRKPSELSGGQQQRVALARILASQPEMLLLDEPFSALDHFLKERLRLEMAQTMHAFGGPSILVTHDRNEAYQLCGHLLLMHEGRIIASGPTKDVFDHPRTVEAARLTGCKNISRVLPLSPHRIRALDWGNLELTTEEEVTEDITHAGIRAHDFSPCGKTAGAEENRANCIPVEDPVLTELPFEWYIVLGKNLWWKVPKDMKCHDFSAQLPESLAVEPAAVMLLREDTVSG